MDGEGKQRVRVRTCECAERAIVRCEDRSQALGGGTGGEGQREELLEMHCATSE